jgi:hypothetical protein
MLAVHKYPFRIEDRFILSLPLGFQILKVECQAGIPCIWALVNPGCPTESVPFRIYGTGHSIKISEIGDHVATFQ